MIVKEYKIYVKVIAKDVSRWKHITKITATVWSLNFSIFSAQELAYFMLSPVRISVRLSVARVDQSKTI